MRSPSSSPSSRIPNRRAGAASPGHLGSYLMAHCVGRQRESQSHRSVSHGPRLPDLASNQPSSAVSLVLWVGLGICFILPMPSSLWVAERGPCPRRVPARAGALPGLMAVVLVVESPVIKGLPSHSYGFPRLTWLLLRRARVGYMFLVAHASPLLPAPGEVVGSASMRNLTSRMGAHLRTFWPPSWPLSSSFEPPVSHH